MPFARPEQNFQTLTQGVDSNLLYADQDENKLENQAIYFNEIENDNDKIEKTIRSLYEDSSFLANYPFRLLKAYQKGIIKTIDDYRNLHMFWLVAEDNQNPAWRISPSKTTVDSLLLSEILKVISLDLGSKAKKDAFNLKIKAYLESANELGKYCLIYELTEQVRCATRSPFGHLEYISPPASPIKKLPSQSQRKQIILPHQVEVLALEILASTENPPVYPMLQISPAEGEIDDIVKQYQNNQHILQLAFPFPDSNFNNHPVADGNRLSRFSFYKHDYLHCFWRTLVTTPHRNLLSYLYDEVNKKITSFSIIDIPLNTIFEQAETKDDLSATSLKQCFIPDLIRCLHLETTLEHPLFSGKEETFEKFIKLVFNKLYSLTDSQQEKYTFSLEEFKRELVRYKEIFNKNIQDTKRYNLFSHMVKILYMTPFKDISHLRDSNLYKDTQFQAVLKHFGESEVPKTLHLSSESDVFFSVSNQEAKAKIEVNFENKKLSVTLSDTKVEFCYNKLQQEDTLYCFQLLQLLEKYAESLSNFEIKDQFKQIALFVLAHYQDAIFPSGKNQDTKLLAIESSPIENLATPKKPVNKNTQNVNMNKKVETMFNDSLTEENCVETLSFLRSENQFQLFIKNETLKKIVSKNHVVSTHIFQFLVENNKIKFIERYLEDTEMVGKLSYRAAVDSLSKNFSQYRANQFETEIKKQFACVNVSFENSPSDAIKDFKSKYIEDVKQLNSLVSADNFIFWLNKVYKTSPYLALLFKPNSTSIRRWKGEECTHTWERMMQLLQNKIATLLINHKQSNSKNDAYLIPTLKEFIKEYTKAKVFSLLNPTRDNKSGSFAYNQYLLYSKPRANNQNNAVKTLESKLNNLSNKLLQ